MKKRKGIDGKLDIAWAKLVKLKAGDPGDLSKEHVTALRRKLYG